MTDGTIYTKAQDDLDFLFLEAPAAAAGLKAVTWNVLEEAKAGTKKAGSSTPGVKRGAPPMVDPHPDSRGEARARLRRVYASWCRVSMGAQVVLEAYHNPLSAHSMGGVHGVPREWARVASLLEPAQSAPALREALGEEDLDAEHMTPVVRASMLVSALGEEVVVTQCRALYQGALEAFVRARFPGHLLQQRVSS